MKPSRPQMRWFAAAIAAAALSGTCFLLASCDSGDNSSPSGDSTIVGTVVSYSAGASIYVPSPRPKGIARVVAAVMDVLIPNASAAVPGVRIKVVGADLDTTTDDNGFFVISGVPSGMQTLEFIYASTVASLGLDVPAHATITLDGIRISGSVVTFSHKSVDVHDVAPAGNSADGTNGTSGSASGSGSSTSVSVVVEIPSNSVTVSDTLTNPASDSTVSASNALSAAMAIPQP